eukprot:3110480-Rhodomonas_salina.1
MLAGVLGGEGGRPDGVRRDVALGAERLHRVTVQRAVLGHPDPGSPRHTACQHRRWRMVMMMMMMMMMMRSMASMASEEAGWQQQPTRVQRAVDRFRGVVGCKASLSRSVHSQAFLKLVGSLPEVLGLELGELMRDAHHLPQLRQPWLANSQARPEEAG